MTRFALYVPLQAKPGKEKEVTDFLRSAVPLVNDEPGTVSWFAIQEGPSSFAIFDTFDDEAGRDAHLNGKVASAGSLYLAFSYLPKVRTTCKRAELSN
jgi:quinol monooxygenase YgiN